MRLADGGRFIVAEQIVGVIANPTVATEIIRYSPSNVYWFTNYSIFYHGHRKDRGIHLGTISTNIASVLVF